MVLLLLRLNHKSGNKNWKQVPGVRTVQLISLPIHGFAEAALKADCSSHCARQVLRVPIQADENAVKRVAAKTGPRAGGERRSQICRQKTV